jgi:hypothetical protein
MQGNAMKGLHCFQAYTWQEPGLKQATLFKQHQTKTATLWQGMCGFQKDRLPMHLLSQQLL